MAVDYPHEPQLTFNSNKGMQNGLLDMETFTNRLKNRTKHSSLFSSIAPKDALRMVRFTNEFNFTGKQ
jgi:hypothetical protein